MSYERKSVLIPAFDCLVDCVDHDPPCQGRYGRGCEQWAYMLRRSAGDSGDQVGAELVVRTANCHPKTPQAMIPKCLEEWNATLAIHAGFYTEPTALIREYAPVYKECWMTGGGPCYGGPDWSGLEGSLPHRLLGLVNREQFEQSEDFWRLFEELVAPIFDEQIALGLEVCRHEKCAACDGRGFRVS